MNARSRWGGGSCVALALVVWVLAPTAQGKGAPHAAAHHSGGSYHPPHFSMPKPQAYHVPKMPKFAQPRPAQANASAGAHRNTAAHGNANAAPRGSSAARGTPRSMALRNNASRNKTSKNGVNGTLAATGASTLNPTRTASAYAPYGYRGGVRRNRGHSYGSRYYGRRSYGNRNYQAQQFNRMLVSRLRSAHRNLAQLNRDYQGHRVQAMRAISLAARQLGGSTNYYRGMNAFGNAGLRNNGLGNRAGVGGAGVGRLSQAQSDSRMRRSQRLLRNVNMQLMNYGYTTRHARSVAYVQRGIQHLNVALTVR